MGTMRRERPQAMQSSPSLPGTQPRSSVVLEPAAHALGTGHSRTSSELLLERQFASWILSVETSLPAAEQSMPSLHGRQTSSLDLYLPGRQTHSVAPGASDVR